MTLVELLAVERSEAREHGAVARSEARAELPLARVGPVEIEAQVEAVLVSAGVFVRRQGRAVGQRRGALPGVLREVRTADLVRRGAGGARVDHAGLARAERSAADLDG